jgi:hypothetical protein
LKLSNRLTLLKLKDQILHSRETTGKVVGNKTTRKDRGNKTRRKTMDNKTTSNVIDNKTTRQVTCNKTTHKAIDNNSTHVVIKDSHEADIKICDAVFSGSHKHCQETCCLRFQR